MARRYQQGKKWGTRRPREHNGYIEEWCPVRNRYVYQHRLVVERRIGRLLEKHEVVHHEDGDKQNNADSNLVHHDSHAEHIAQHVDEGTWGWPKGKPRGDQKQRIPCPVCGVFFKPKRRTDSAGKRVDTKTCSQSCGQRLRQGNRPPV